MVLFFTSTAYKEPVKIFMGRDKVENEDLLAHGFPEDVWFHVDKFSSAHVYLRMPEGMEWTSIPEGILEDCSQLVKANSIEGNKKNNITIIYTPHANVKKTGDMAVGTVMFHNDRLVKRFHVKERKNEIVNRLNKTKEVRAVDFEAERQERERAVGRKKKEHALQQQKETLEAKRMYKEQAEARDYSKLFSEEAIAEEQRAKERRARIRAAQKTQGEEDEAYESDDSFM
ncbi:Coiled-coil domain-containing protein 25 [Malassezia restricta CBS 7877]|uniref:Coiled-coil domain-containing protein 25 n=1 Tax=Malassezia restricta (strain ATCC 96810 / NBRC 103918 / CBS 7877) TaxID=425264 RepID=A0A3G2SBG1_MALR7|nr:Coiled-coil domain-containing protein 25 [Malassezia restricta CBS 7877]